MEATQVCWEEKVNQKNEYLHDEVLGFLKHFAPDCSREREILGRGSAMEAPLRSESLYRDGASTAGRAYK